MTEFDKLLHIAANPGSYGDTIKLRVMEGGGVVLDKLDGTGEIVLDPDQMKEMKALLVSDPSTLRNDLMNRLMEEAIPQQLMKSAAIGAGWGFIIGLVTGWLLF